LIIRPPLRSPLFPYTTLFRSTCVLLSWHRTPPQPWKGNHGQCESVTVSRRPVCDTCWQKRAAVSGSDPRSRPPPVLHPRTAYDPDRKSTRLNSSHVAISYAVF